MVKAILTATLVFLILSLPIEAQIQYPFFDDVEVDSISNSYWKPDSATWAIVTVTAHSGSKAWKFVPTTGNYAWLSLKGEIDLSLAPNPYFSLWIMQTSLGDASRGFYKVQISTDNGTSWSDLIGETATSGQMIWTQRTVSLEQYKGFKILIRIGVRDHTGYGGYPTYYIDDIILDDAPMPTYVRLSDATGNGMRISWGQSSASDFYRYRLVISTDVNEVNNWWGGSYVSGRKERRVIDIFNKARVETTLTDLVFTNTVYYVKLYEQDTVGFMNVGTDVAFLSTSFSPVVEVAPFTQDFEGGVGWAWDLPWGIVSYDSSVPGHSYKNVITDSPEGVYPADADRRLYAKISFGATLSPVLYFNHRYSFETDADWGNVYFTPDLQNFYRIGYFTGIQGDYRGVEFDMRPIKGISSGGWLVFQLSSNSSNNYDGWYIDDVKIYNITGFTSFPFFDSFNDSTSLDNWILGLWNYEYGLWVKMTPKSGDWSYIVLRKPIDLSGSANPYLSFKIKKVAGGYAYYTVDVSVDGGYSWYNLLSTGVGGSFDWRKVDVSLLNYKGKNVLIRIGVRHAGDSFSTYYIDDISINEYIEAPKLVMPSNGATDLDIPVNLSWTSVLGAIKYQIQISTDSLFSNIIIDDSTLTKTQYTASTLKQNMTYYWRVRAMDSLYSGPWSSVYKFTTRFAQIDSLSIPLSNGWNMISSYVIPVDIALDSVLSKVRGNLRLLKDGFGNVYWPDLNIDQVRGWSVKLGYQVNMKFQDTLIIVGYKVSPGNTPIDLLKGWNIIAYLLDRPMDIDSALLSIANYIVIVKDNSGRVYWPSFSIDQIGSMSPGQGYQIYVSRACTLIYPTNYSTSPHIISAKIQSNSYDEKHKFYRNSISGTGNNAVLLIESNDFEDGDEIAVLTTRSDIIVGSAIIHGKRAILTVWGDDISTQEKDGAEEGEVLKLKYWSAKLNKEVPLIIKNITDPLTGEFIHGVLKYKTDAVLIVEAEPLNTIPSSYVLEQNYPNPFNPYTTIKYGLPKDSKITIEVFDVLGRRVAVLVDQYQTAGLYEVVFHADELPSGMYIYRMIANGSVVISKKMLLVK